jgi:enamine deaminase RidA (YjgF/YER057c/UK114 family)
MRWHGELDASGRKTMSGDIQRTLVEPEGVAKPLGQYSHVVTVRPARLAFIAGQVSVDEAGRTVGVGDLAAQTRQVFHNLERVLESVGGSFGDVVKFTTYIVRGQRLEGFTSARTEVFSRVFPGGGYPPNTLLFIDRLVREEFLVEIEAVAALP